MAEPGFGDCEVDAADGLPQTVEENASKGHWLESSPDHPLPLSLGGGGGGSEELLLVGPGSDSLSPSRGLDLEGTEGA